jgi:hypothetical protein
MSERRVKNVERRPGNVANKRTLKIVLKNKKSRQKNA